MIKDHQSWHYNKMVLIDLCVGSEGFIGSWQVTMMPPCHGWHVRPCYACAPDPVATNTGGAKGRGSSHFLIPRPEYMKDELCWIIRMVKKCWMTPVDAELPINDLSHTWAISDHMPTVCQPYAAICQPYANHMSTIYQPHLPAIIKHIFMMGDPW